MERTREKESERDRERERQRQRDKKIETVRDRETKISGNQSLAVPWERKKKKNKVGFALKLDDIFSNNFCDDD